MKYRLFDLEITTVGDPSRFNCSHVIGQGLIVRGENISLKLGTTQFSHYVLASLLPYIAAKQRCTDGNDWMSYETDISCPDPQCSAVFTFRKIKQTYYEYGEQ